MPERRCGKPHVTRNCSPARHYDMSRRATMERNVLSEIGVLRAQLNDFAIFSSTEMKAYWDPTPCRAREGFTPRRDQTVRPILWQVRALRFRRCSRTGHNKAVTELCCYLVSRPGTIVAKDELIELLWPDTDPQRLAHRFHVTVSALRGALAASRSGANLISAEDSYSVLSEALVTDCDLFEELYEGGRSAANRGEYDRQSPP